jgi:hypothetical protein
VAILEGLLQEFSPAIASDHLSQPGPRQPEEQRSIQAWPQFSHPATANHQPSLPRDVEHDEISDLASNVGLLSLSAPGAEPHYLGSSSLFAFSRVVSSSLRRVDFSEPYTATRSEEGLAPTPSPCPLPTYDDAVALSDAYFRHIHPQYPFLHQSTIRTWEASLTRSCEPHDFHPMSFFFLYMVRLFLCALA